MSPPGIVMMIDDEEENLADDSASAIENSGGEEEGGDLSAEWAAMAGGGDAEGGEEEGDDLAAEWAAMADGGSDDGYSESSRVLDQAEIDSLLGFQEGDDIETERSGIEAIIDSGMVSYERLPMLEVVFDRLVRMMSTSLRNFTSDNVEVSLVNITSIRFGDYLNSIPLPAMLTVFKVEEWDNFGLITVDSSLIYSIVDVLLGGRRGTAAMRIEGRPYTTIERNLVERLINVVLTDLGGAFDPLASVTCRFDRLETNPGLQRSPVRRMRRLLRVCGSIWRIAAVVWNYCCPTRRSNRFVNCCFRCSWARSSVGTPFGRTTLPLSSGLPTSSWMRFSMK